MLWRGINYLHCSSTVSNFCSFPSSAAVGIVTLVGCRARASLSGPWFLRTAPGYYSIVLRYLVLVSLSFLWKCVICCGSSSTECFRLCLKWLTSFLHFAKALSNVLFLKTNYDGSMNGMCNTRHMLKWQLPGRCDQVASTTSGQCAHFMFNVPLSSNLHEMFSPHVSKMPLLCLHNSQSMRVKFPLWSKLMCYYS